MKFGSYVGWLPPTVKCRQNQFIFILIMLINPFQIWRFLLSMATYFASLLCSQPCQTFLAIILSQKKKKITNAMIPFSKPWNVFSPMGSGEWVKSGLLSKCFISILLAHYPVCLTVDIKPFAVPSLAAFHLWGTLPGMFHPFSTLLQVVHCCELSQE